MYSTSVTIFNFTELPLLPSDNGSLDYGADSGQKDQSNPVWGMPMFENNALANLSDAEYLAMVLGPKNVGLPLLIPITIIYVLIFISGVIGNVAVCLVIIKNKSMHTATNYYLFSLAISDLMILVLDLPPDSTHSPGAAFLMSSARPEGARQLHVRVRSTEEEIYQCRLHLQNEEIAHHTFLVQSVEAEDHYRHCNQVPDIGNTRSRSFSRQDFVEVELQSQDSISMLCKSNANLKIYADEDQGETGEAGSSHASSPGLPNDLAIYWQQYPWMLGEAMCKGRSLVSEMTSYSSVLIIVSFSMERYLAICHPLYSHTMSGFKRAVRIICLVWLISLVSAIPYAIFTRLNYIDRPLNSGNYLEESAFCALLDDNIYPKNYPVHQLSSFLFFIFPMGILVILYIRMGFRIRQTSEIQRNLPRSNTQNHHNNHHGGGGGNNGTHPPGSSGSFTDRMDRHTAGSRRTVLRMLFLGCGCCQTRRGARVPLCSGESTSGEGATFACVCGPNKPLLPPIQPPIKSLDEPLVSLEEDTEADAGDSSGGEVLILDIPKEDVGLQQALLDAGVRPAAVSNPKSDDIVHGNRQNSLGSNSSFCPVCSDTHASRTQDLSRGDDTDSFTPRIRSDKRSVTILLAAVVFAFFLCWAPFHAQRLSYVYFKESMIFRTINEYLYYVSGFLYYLSATVNPILYNLMSLKYRHAFRQTLCGKGTSSRRRRPGTINRSYTFRSTTRTVVENNGSDWDPRMRNEPRGSFRKRSQDGAAQRFSFHKSNCSEGNHLNSSTSDKSSVAPGGGLGRRARSYPDRSEFQHAMHLANATFSDIIEEDSQVSNSGGGGLRLSQPSLVSPCCSLPLEKTADIKFTIGQPGAPPLINFVAQGRCSLSRSRSTSPKPVTVDSCCQTTGESDGFLMKCRCFPVPNDSGDKQRCGGKCNEWVTPGESVLLDEVGAVGQLPLPLEQANAFEGVVKDDDDQDSGNGSVSELHALFDRESQARLNGVQHTKA